MRLSFWGLAIAVQSVAIGYLVSLPNSFYNQPSTLAQYAGYGRGISPIVPLATSVLFFIDYERAIKKKARLRSYCPKLLQQSYDSVQVYKFLAISQNQIDKAIYEHKLLDDYSACSNHAITTFFKDLHEQ